MKKNFALVFAIILITCMISGCSKTGYTKNPIKDVSEFDGFENTDYNYETDHQYFFEMSSGFVSVENGYLVNYYNMLFYVEKGSMELIPVCSRADCEHNTTDCDAYIQAQLSLGYYNGSLYYFYVDEPEFGDRMVYRRSLDGSIVERICTPFTGSTVPSGIVHRGYMYYEEDYSDDTAGFIRVNLDKKDSAELVYKYDSCGGGVFGLTGYGDGVLFGRSYALDEDYSAFRYDLCYYDSNNNTVELIIDEFTGGFTVAEDNIYYQKGDMIYKYDTKTFTSEPFYEMESRVFISYDGKYIYLNNEKEAFFGLIPEKDMKLVVIDLDGNYVDTIESNGRYFMYGDEDYLFWGELNGIGYLDKNQIGTGEFNRSIMIPKNINVIYLD